MVAEKDTPQGTSEKRPDIPTPFAGRLVRCRVALWAVGVLWLCGQ